jgi:head-tail adaptor
MISLGRLRRLSNRALPDSADVVRYMATNTADGVVQDWQPIATGVPCRVSPIGSGATETIGSAEQVQAINQWTVWLPAETDVTVLDRIVVGSRTFEVGRVGARSYETVRECVTKEVN